MKNSFSRSVSSLSSSTKTHLTSKSFTSLADTLAKELCTNLTRPSCLQSGLRLLTISPTSTPTHSTRMVSISTLERNTCSTRTLNLVTRVWHATVSPICFSTACRRTIPIAHTQNLFVNNFGPQSNILTLAGSPALTVRLRRTQLTTCHLLREHSMEQPLCQWLEMDRSGGSWSYKETTMLGITLWIDAWA